jgi:hypothetical protein
MANGGDQLLEPGDIEDSGQPHASQGVQTCLPGTRHGILPRANVALHVEQAPRCELRRMSKEEFIIQLVKVALGVVVAGYFFWWSLEVLKRLPPPQ